MRSARVSVVMSVFNGERTLARAIEGILAQTMGDLEFIIVDDGSTDASADMLASYAARDARIRVIAQENAGLTKALIRGCAAAQAPFIARQDADEYSYPRRLEQQFSSFADDVVVVSSWARAVGPAGEYLFDVKRDGVVVRDRLLHAGISSIMGVQHGTAVFRRDHYAAAGGYRAEFRFAQDLDLWIRLAPRGRFVVVPETLMEFGVSATAITSTRRKEQFALAEIAIAIRNDPSAERVLLQRAAEIGVQPQSSTARDRAKGLYFIASSLRRNGDRKWRQYAWQALRDDPWNIRVWFLLIHP